MYRHFIKPLGDFIISLFLLIILSPIILITTFLLLFANNGNIFFFQKRPGFKCKPFTIIKFKTMKDAFDVNGVPLPDEIRLTKIGKFIRSASLDEVLQLINVLKGDMSLVGPRPLLMKYLDKYNDEQLRRHDVKPGITGLAQIRGRNTISWEQKFIYDIEYIKKQNLILDMKILIITFKNVLFRKGISPNDKIIMDEFSGNKINY
jgi:undecaprenyl phosphate N,N'-diacetylbacillosamine 1-phosphate transferase